MSAWRDLVADPGDADPGEIDPGSRVAAALALPVARRRAAFAEFFGAHPGAGRRGLGLGTALDDFLAWEVASGRVLDGPGGSPWWKAVNGLMVLDIAAAAAGGPGLRSPAARAWAAYAAGAGPDDQAALWEAHGASMHAAVAAVRPLLDAEPAAEPAFVAVVLDVLDRATARCSATDGPGLGDQARASYPGGYPAAAEEVVALRAAVARRSGPPAERT